MGGTKNVKFVTKIIDSEKYENWHHSLKSVLLFLASYKIFKLLKQYTDWWKFIILVYRQDACFFCANFSVASSPLFVSTFLTLLDRLISSIISFSYVLFEIDEAHNGRRKHAFSHSDIIIDNNNNSARIGVVNNKIWKMKII